VVEISHPVIDRKDLVYQYKLINGAMPKGGGATALFIDWIGVGRWCRSGFSRRRSQCPRGRPATMVSKIRSVGFIGLFFIRDEQRRATYRCHPHLSWTCYDHSVIDFRETLRIGSRAKVDPGGGKNIGAPTSFTA
jgi:hypothetical protein